MSSYVELDSHADTCCAGSNCAVIEVTERKCNVIGFSCNNSSSEINDILIVKAGYYLCFAHQ
jgi:hypothetical protein